MAIPVLPAVLGGTALAGVFVTFWEKIKLYSSKFYSIFVVRIELQGMTSATAMSMLLWRGFKCSKLGRKFYRGTTEYVRSIKKKPAGDV